VRAPPLDLLIFPPLATTHQLTKIPFGWYFVAYSDELDVGDVKSLHYFGRDLVLFRNESGQAGVLDAYCPHMGAHLGEGGVVDGDSLRCHAGG
jgi:phenylpropionate dioxygenase-like ring-hydroxylating dioxygenase large terminal subunit